MATVFQDQNLFLITGKNLMVFEWKFEKSDMEIGKVFRSKRFNTGEKESSFLEMFVNSKGNVFLKLHNPKFVSGGNYIISIYDNTQSRVFNSRVSLDTFSMLTEVDLLGNFSKLPFSTKFPIIVTCFAKSLITYSLRISNNSEELSLDFKKILDQAINYDIELNVNGESIKAHKAVLQVRSPVFNKMFDHDTSEVAKNTVVISDVGAPTMKKVISFLYTGMMEKCDFEEVLELYYAADKYEVLSLREDCKAVLLNSIVVDNACSLFALANRHSDDAFLNEIVEFVSGNFKPVLHTDSFDELSKDDMKLLMCLCATAMKK